MLSIREFKNEFVSSCRDGLRRSYPVPMNIEEQTVHKAQYGDLTGLIFRNPEAAGAPTLYVEDFYDLYKKGYGIEHLSHEAVRTVLCSLEQARSLPGEDFDFGKHSEMFRVRMLRHSDNEALLGSAPHRFEADELALVVYAETGEYRVLITNGIFEGLEMTEDEFFATAFENAVASEPPVMLELTDALFDDQDCSICCSEVPARNYLSGCYDSDGPDSDHGIQNFKGKLFVLSNSDLNWGAAALFYPGVIDRVHSLLGDPFYVLPSSVHELLVVSAEGADPRHLADVIRSANETVVSTYDKLSDELFICESAKLRKYSFEEEQ